MGPVAADCPADCRPSADAVQLRHLDRDPLAQEGEGLGSAQRVGGDCADAGGLNGHGPGGSAARRTTKVKGGAAGPQEAAGRRSRRANKDVVGATRGGSQQAGRCIGTRYIVPGGDHLGSLAQPFSVPEEHLAEPGGRDARVVCELQQCRRRAGRSQELDQGIVLQREGAQGKVPLVGRGRASPGAIDTSLPPRAGVRGILCLGGRARARRAVIPVPEAAQANIAAAPASGAPPAQEAAIRHLSQQLLAAQARRRRPGAA